MTLPEPQAGLVISYAYLWHHEDSGGATEGRKNRPCAIVLAQTSEDGERIVTVLPITHSLPADMNEAVEIPQATKKRLGLDAERSWIICSEVNKFIWPGPDLRPISARQKDKFAYGFLPPKLFKIIKAKIAYLARGRKLKLIRRGE